MEDRHKEILQKNRKALVDDIHVSVIINDLIQSNILNSTLKDEIIKPNPTTHGQIEALLDMLPKRGPRAFKVFCNALRENYDWLADILESADRGGITDDKKGDWDSLKGQNNDDLLQDASVLPMNKLTIREHVQQPTYEEEIPYVCEIFCVNAHPVQFKLEVIQLTLSGPQELLNIALTDPQRKTVNLPIERIRKNIYKATFKAANRGLYHARVVTRDNIVLAGGKYEFTIESNNPVWKLGSRGSCPGQFDNPLDVEIDRDGNFFVADCSNFRVVKVSPLGKYVSHFNLCNMEENKKNRIKAIAINNKEEEIVCIKGYNDDDGSTFSNTIQVYSMQGDLKFEHVNPDMKQACDVTVNSRGQIIVCDWAVRAIFIGSRQGKHIQWQKVGKKGQGPGEFLGPLSITTGLDDDIIVCDTGRVQVLNKNNTYKHHFGGQGQELGRFLNTSGVAMDEDNNILVSDNTKNVIQVFSYDGEFISCIDSEGDELHHPQRLTVTGDGHVIVADMWNHCIKNYQYK